MRETLVLAAAGNAWRTGPWRTRAATLARVSSALLLSVTLSSALAAQPAGCSLTTGLDPANNSLFPVGQSDPPWAVTFDVAGGPTPRPAVVDGNPGWLTIPGTEWISANSFGPVGEYDYQFCFCLVDGFSNPKLDILLRADNQAVAAVNGGPGMSGANNSFGTSQPDHFVFSSLNTKFHNGSNCLTVKVRNDGGPTGLDVGGTMTANGPNGTGDGVICGRDCRPPMGLLKVCKVAGPGVAVGTVFTFTAPPFGTFTVPAGPAPGGTCTVGPRLPVGSTVVVAEVIPAGDAVSSISVAPPGQVVGTPNLAAGTVNVLIGSGVTEVTYTDKRTGFLEICKQGDVQGNFTFSVNPGGLGPFVVPAGSCSPAIEVPAGSVLISEVHIPGIFMAGCATIPAGQQGPCDPATQTSTVNVAPGDVSTQTLAIVTNHRIIRHPSTGDATQLSPSHPGLE